MGRLLHELDLVPDAIVSSTAVRALSTARAAADACGYGAEIRARHDLYLAEPGAYLAVLQALEPGLRRVLVVGHNPALEELVEGVSSASPRLPTAALARVDLPIEDWSELELDRRGVLVGLWRPRQLA